MPQVKPNSSRPAGEGRNNKGPPKRNSLPALTSKEKDILYLQTGSFSRGRRSWHPGTRPRTTEYVRSFSPARLRPKVRNAQPAWGTRNQSDILPTETSTNNNNRPATANQRRPFVDRNRTFNITVGAGQMTGNRQNDTNNNPILVTGRRPNRDRGPTEISQVLRQVVEVGDEQQRFPAFPARRLWPWQERSYKADVLNNGSSPDSVTPRRKGGYAWDQRISNQVFDVTTASGVARAKEKTVVAAAAWPWQERAKESLIFTALPAPPIQPLYYPWDQRQSDPIIIDPEAKFVGETRYHQDFTAKGDKTAEGLPPAGITYYSGKNQPSTLDPILLIPTSSASGKRMFPMSRAAPTFTLSSSSPRSNQGKAQEVRFSYQEQEEQDSSPQDVSNSMNDTSTTARTFVVLQDDVSNNNNSSSQDRQQSSSSSSTLTNRLEGLDILNQSSNENND